VSDRRIDRTIARQGSAEAPVAGGTTDDAVSARDVVFTFSYETWSDAKWRGMMRPPERILTTLMNSDEVRRLLVANPWRWWPSSVARGMIGFTRRFPRTQHRHLVSPLRSDRADPTDVAGLQAAYAEYDRKLQHGVDHFGLETPSVITASPVVAAFSPLDWAASVTYFGRDDWLSSPGRRAYWPAYREAYRRISASGIGVTAVSQQIIDRIAPTGPHAVVPNGVEPAEWLGVQRPAPRWFAALPKPRAVYVGTIDSRVDIEGLIALAKRRPDVSIVLLGTSQDAAGTAALRELPNVHVHRAVGRHSVVSVLRAADLSLLAHRRTELTTAMSPLKVYEYLAAGLPVLATDLPPVRGLGDRVMLVDEVADFADVLDAAFELGRADEADRMRFVQQNSWASRHQAILDIAFGRS
jgi:glycosyltransferase involved in cell wall biosynthesis